VRIAFISASLGQFDKDYQSLHVKQNLDVDFFYFTDADFPPRPNVISPRLMAKYPKMMAWELVPGYDYYVWADAVITLKSENAVAFLVGKCLGYDMAFFRHQDHRPNIESELSFMEAHMDGSTGNSYARSYLNNRYGTEPMRHQLESYTDDPTFVDDKLYSGGLFIYENSIKNRRVMRNWFFECVLHSVQDQISLPYVLSQGQVNVKEIDLDITENEYTDYHWRNKSNLGKWDSVYRDLPQEPGAFIYGDTCSYEMGAEQLKDCETVEDWGTGAGGFKRFRPDAIGVDGSHTIHADVVADLATHKTEVDGVFMRHVLEHNFEWKPILINAMKSARKVMVLVLFTPLSEGKTVKMEGAAEENISFGVDVPTLSLSKEELFATISAWCFSFTVDRIASGTRYGEETVIVIQRQGEMALAQ
jgi:hypothetical protein